MHGSCQNPRVRRETKLERRRPGAASSAPAQYPRFPAPSSRPAPELSPPRPLALPLPSPAARAEHCGTQTKCPQTGWSERSGNRGGAGPHARGGGSLPTSPPLPSLPFPFPTPPRRENASRRLAPQTAACPRPTAPNGRPRAAHRAPSLLPSGPQSAPLPPPRTLPPRRHAAARGRHAPAAGCPRA